MKGQGPPEIFPQLSGTTTLEKGVADWSSGWGIMQVVLPSMCICSVLQDA